MICVICGELCNRVIAGYSLCSAHASKMVASVVDGVSPEVAFRDAVLEGLREGGLM